MQHTYKSKTVKSDRKVKELGLAGLQAGQPYVELLLVLVLQIATHAVQQVSQLGCTQHIQEQHH